MLRTGSVVSGISQFLGVFMMLGFVTLMIRTGIEESVYQAAADENAGCAN